MLTTSERIATLEVHVDNLQNEIRDLRKEISTMQAQMTKILAICTAIITATGPIGVKVIALLGGVGQ